MKFTILVPHWKTSHMTTFALYQFQQMKGRHEIEIIVIDNNAGDGSLEFVKTSLAGTDILDNVRFVDYPKDKLQSHAIAFDYVINNGMVNTQWFICAESDSFPRISTWLDYYEDLIEKGYDCAASLLQLSGGVFNHPTGGLFNKTTYFECKNYVDTIPYKYIPHIAIKEGFPCHLMVRNDIWDAFLINPDKFIEMSPTYKRENIVNEQQRYLPVAQSVFHNGMGAGDEFLSTYGSRTIGTEPEITLVNESSRPLIFRMGEEPGQFFCFWMRAMNKKIFNIPTKTQWLPNRIHQNQEYTETINGFLHVWGISSYHGADIDGMMDVIEFKRKQVEGLYDSLPSQYKI